MQGAINNAARVYVETYIGNRLDWVRVHKRSAKDAVRIAAQSGVKDFKPYTYFGFDTLVIFPIPNGTRK